MPCWDCRDLAVTKAVHTLRGQESSRGHRMSNPVKGEGCWDDDVEGGRWGPKEGTQPGWGVQVVIDSLQGK